MKNNERTFSSVVKGVIFCLAMLLLMMLGGCGKMETMTVNTQLNINRNFDGERVMTMTMTSSVVDKLFNGDRDLMRQTIEKYCPGDMGCSIEDAGDNVNIRFVIPFASITDYQIKISHILDSDSNPNKTQVNASVYYDYSDSMFKHGYVIKEEFTSTDMFYWLDDAIRTEFPEFEDADLSALYTAGSNTLVFEGTAINCGEKIDYSTMDSTAFKSVTITTDMTGADGTYAAQVDLVLDRDKYDLLQTSEINAKMQELASDTIHYTVSLTNTQKIFSYAFTASSDAQFAAYLNQIFGSTDSVFSVGYEQSEDAALQARKLIQCYVNAGYYVDFSDSDSTIKWIFKVDDGYRLENIYDKYGYIQSSEDMTQNDEHLIEIVTSASEEITVQLGTDINLTSISVSTIVHNEKNLERTFEFCLADDMDALAGTNLLNLIKERVNNFMTYERQENGLDKTVLYRVTIKATSAELLAKLTCGFLDGNDVSGRSQMNGGMNERNTLKQIQMQYSDKIDFSQFLGGSDVTNGILYSFEYPKNYTASLTDSDEYENVSTEHNQFSFITRNKSIVVTSYAQKVNIRGIIQQILWYVSFAVILVLILFNIPTAIKCIRRKRVDLQEIGLFTKKGYVFTTIAAVCVVVFVITSIRLIFRIY